MNDEQPIYSNSEYKILKELYLKSEKEFIKKIEITEQEIFKNLNKRKRNLELSLEKDFKELWDLFGIKEYLFEKFQFDFNMRYGPHHYFYIMDLRTPKENLSLENLAKKYPTKKRKEQILEQNPKYKETKNKIKKELEKIGFDGGNLPKEIKDFLNFHGILQPQVKYFKIHKN